MIVKENSSVEWEDIFSSKLQPIKYAIEQLQKLERSHGSSSKLIVHYDYDATYLSIVWEREETKEEAVARIKKEEADKRRERSKKDRLEVKERLELNRLRIKYASPD